VFWILAIAGVLVALLFVGNASGGLLSFNLPTSPNGTPVPPAPSTAVWLLARAIAIAEGSPAGWNNPGDLTRSFGFANQGPQNSAGVLKFNSSADGWNALYQEISDALGGTSTVYSPGTSIAQMAQLWTGGDNADAWANTVASQLGVSTTTTIGEAVPS
jgi:hypothetical protein